VDREASNVAPRDLPIYLTVDIGPALAALGHGQSADADWTPTFRALPLLCETVSMLEDQLGQPMPMTWFIRADEGVQRQFGSKVAVVQRFLDAMAPTLLRSQELGWMPRLPVGVRDSSGHDALDATHDQLLTLLSAIDSVRMGDLHHDNRAMGILDRLGVRFDCTAVPGRVKFDPGWHVDWRGTPASPYHPSIDDYRRPGTPHWNLLELPMTVIPMQAPYDREPLLRYVNPCFHAPFLWPALAQGLRDSAYLVCLWHPDELLPGPAGGHPMVSYSPATFASNLLRLADQAAACGRRPRFARIRDHGIKA
jgi:hypothetical protein